VLPPRRGDRWFVDETSVKVAGRWMYLYRAVDRFGQIIDVLAFREAGPGATRRFLTRAPRRSQSHRYTSGCISVFI